MWSSALRMLFSKGIDSTRPSWNELTGAGQEDRPFPGKSRMSVQAEGCHDRPTTLQHRRVCKSNLGIYNRNQSRGALPEIEVDRRVQARNGQLEDKGRQGIHCVMR